MQIQSSPLQAYSAGSAAGSAASKLGNAISSHPILAITDTVDVGVGSSLALSAVSTPAAAGLLQGAGVVMGGYHAVKGFVHMCNGIGACDSGYSGKPHFTKMAGEILSSVGMFSAAAGVGPVSLGFLALGTIVTSAQTLSE